MTRASLTTPRAIAEMVRAAHDHGFNTILVQVRGRGDVLSEAESRAPPSWQTLSPSFDPLAEVIDLARPAGLRVHAWINGNLIGSAVELPSDRNHLLYRHPEWLMVPRELAPQLAMFEPNNPAYAGAISRWTRGQAGAVEGLRVADHSGRRRSCRVHRHEPRAAMRPRWSPSRLHPVSEGDVRLQPVPIAQFRTHVAPTLSDASVVRLTSVPRWICCVAGRIPG